MRLRKHRRSVTLILPNGRKQLVTRATARKLHERGHTKLVSERPFMLELKWWALFFYQRHFRWSRQGQGALLMALLDGSGDFWSPADFSISAAKPDPDPPHRWGRSKVPTQRGELLRQQQEKLFALVREWEQLHRKRFPWRVLRTIMVERRKTKQ